MMRLKRDPSAFLEAGIFGEIIDEQGEVICQTLEHAYPDGNGGWVPKVAPGVYTCVRHLPNRLPYETFMILAVPPFQNSPVSGILFHCGNFDADSEGCILLGLMNDGDKEILQSKIAFEAFMTTLEGVQSFEITIA